MASAGGSACDSSGDPSPDQHALEDTSMSTNETSFMSIDDIPTPDISLMSIDSIPMMHQEQATPMSIDQTSTSKLSSMSVNQQRESPSVSGNPRSASEMMDQPPLVDSASSFSVVSPIVSAPAPMAVELYALPLSLSATDGPAGDKLGEKDQPFNSTSLAPFPGQTEVTAGRITIKRTIHEVEHPVEDGDASLPKKRVRVGKESPVKSDSEP